MDIEIQPNEHEEAKNVDTVSTMGHKKILPVLILILIVVIAGYFWKKSSDNLDLTGTSEYTYYDSNAPFTFRYPDDFCATQDIGAVVVHHKNESPCGGNNAINVRGNYLSIVAFPAIPDTENEEKITTTDEYVKSRVPEGATITTEKRNIGGYEAVKITRDGTDEYSWVFLTDYKLDLSELFKDAEDAKVSEEFKKQFTDLGEIYYGIVITPNFDKTPEGENAEKIILSTLKFPKK